MAINKRISIFKVLLLFICILNMGGVASLVLPYNMIDFIPLFLSVGYLIVKKQNLLKGKITSALLFCFILIFLSSIFTSTPLINYKGFFLRLTIAYLVLSVFAGKSEDVRLHFVACLKIIAILATINVILYIVVPFLYSPIVIDDGYQTKTILYIFNYLSYSQLFGLIIYRNQGVFWEPGVLQIPMNILVYNELVVEKKSVKRALIPIFVIITTLSTTGYFLLALIFVFRFMILSKGRISFKQIASLSLLVLLFVPLLRENSHNKLQGEGVASTAYRLQDIALALSFAQEYPLIGIGFDSQKYQRISRGMSLQTYEGVDVSSERGNSNTISEVLVFFGIPLLIFFLIALYKQKIFPNKKMTFVVLVISLATEPLFVTTIIFLILLSATCKLNNNQRIAYQKAYEIIN